MLHPKWRGHYAPSEEDHQRLAAWCDYALHAFIEYLRCSGWFEGVDDGDLYKAFWPKYATSSDAS